MKWSFSASFLAVSKGLLNMRISKNIAARTLISVAVATIPVQGLPTAACACTSTARHSCSQQSDVGPCPCTGARICRCGLGCPCLRPACSCQAARCRSCATSNSLADFKPQCPCGASCQCGQGSGPTKPASTPVETNSSKQLANDSLATPSAIAICQPDAAFPRLDPNGGPDALAAIDRCATLCRFTL